LTIQDYFSFDFVYVILGYVRKRKFWTFKQVENNKARRKSFGGSNREEGVILLIFFNNERVHIFIFYPLNNIKY